jgi:hypothetical protein
MRSAELGEVAGGAAYPAVSPAIKRFEKRVQLDRHLKKKVRAVQRIFNMSDKTQLLRNIFVLLFDRS